MKYVYYPFDDDAGFLTLRALAPGFGNTPTIDLPTAVGVLYRDDGTFLPDLAAITDDDELWIVGHAAAGYKVLGDAAGGTIDQSEIVARLQRCGLPPACHCRVVLYACYSGVGNTRSLAAMVATALRRHGFSCADRVAGFNHEVGMRARKGNDSEHPTLRIKYGQTWMALDHIEEYAITQHAPNQY